MHIPKNLRSFNPHLLSHFKNNSLTGSQYGFKHLVKADECQKIIDKLNLKSQYPDASKKLDIIDVFPGYGLFSTMLNYELKPKNHILMECNKNNVTLWKERINQLKLETNNAENFKLYEKDGYVWESYDDMIHTDKLIQPNTLPMDKTSDELLIVGNLTPIKFGESLLAQWIMCCAYGNWLQKYGLIRMICFTSDHTGSKFTAQEPHIKRNRTSVKRDTFTETKIVALTESTDPNVQSGSGHDPNTLIRDQPLLLPKRAVSSESGDLVILEIIPKKDQLDIDIDLYEYILRILFYKTSSSVRQNMKNLAPGYEEDMFKIIPDKVLNKSSKELSIEDIMYIYKAIDGWAFKPTFEDFISVFDAENRR